MGSLVKELFAYLGARKKWWLLPVLLIIGLFGGLLVLCAGIRRRTVHLHGLLRTPE